MAETRKPAAREPAANTAAARPGPAPTVTTATAGDATATTALAAGPTETGSVTYEPGPGDPEITTAFGRVFSAGESVQIDDPRAFAKLRGNPTMRAGGAKRGPGRPARDPNREKLDEAVRETADEARAKREEANASLADADAAERAARTVAAISEASADPDRTPPLTNHARQGP